MMKPRLAVLRWAGLAVVVCGAALFAGCALRPAGEPAERQKIEEAGNPYVEPVEVPPLPDKPGVDDYLRYAFLSNADLQARYWDWRAAIERVPQVTSLPSIAVPFSFMFGGGNMKLWDRATLGITNDPMTNIPHPKKLETAGRQALEEARATGLRFEEAKVLLQGKVLSTYYDLALLAESVRLQEENIALLSVMVRLSGVRVQTGVASQQDLLRSQTELDLARNALQNLQSQVAPTQARMNALLGRAADAPVPLPEALPEPRPLPVADAEVIRIGSERSPELAALARDVAGREEALSLAKEAYLPDFGLSASLTGTISQTVGGMLVLPTRTAAIRAAIEQAQANLRSTTAARTQYERDLAASFVLNLYVLRNDERQVALFEQSVIPRAREVVQIAQTSYAAGRLTFVDLIDAERTLLDARLAAAQLRTEREKALAAIETWSAVDVETMQPGRTSVGGRGVGGSMP